MKKYLLPLLFISMILYWSCEEQDTSPPDVSILIPDDVVFEIADIAVEADDNEEISRLEFYIDGEMVHTETGPPSYQNVYVYKWNTVQYENGSDHIVRVDAYDNSDNQGSDEANFTVDNSDAGPGEWGPTSVTYTLTQMTITWEEYPEDNFKDYNVLYSHDEEGEKSTLATYTDRSTTFHAITEFDPTIENWFWVQVTDTLGLSSIGWGMRNDLDSEPSPVNVTDVSYNLESMTITWEEYSQNNGRTARMNFQTGSTVTNDFAFYELLQSDSEYGDYSSIATITEQSITSHSISEFDPTINNWFKIKVTDYWGLTSTGSWMTNELDIQPSVSSILSITYDTTPQMTVIWSSVNDSDFASYDLYHSIGGHEGTYASIVTNTDIFDTSHTITEFDPTVENWFKVLVTDVWGLNTFSTYAEKNEYPDPPVAPELQMNFIEKDEDDTLSTDSLSFYWSDNDSIPLTYTLYESAFWWELESHDFTNVTNSWELTDTSITISAPDSSGDWAYILMVEDYWGETVGSNIRSITLCGEGEVGLWENCYSIENTTVLNLDWANIFPKYIPPQIGDLVNLTELILSHNELTGPIPPEIGNLTNLTDLKIQTNNLTGPIPPEIGNLVNLEVIIAGGNDFTGPLPIEFSNLDELTHLTLNDNDIDGEIPYQLGDMDGLNHLDLHRNDLTGEIPSSLSNPDNIYTIDLSKNDLSGEIPTGLCESTTLGNLYLYNNQLSGSIPTEIGNLANMNNLNLKNNQLTGEIPESICNLSAIIELEGNQLCPPYPSCFPDGVEGQSVCDCENVDMAELWGYCYLVENTTELNLWNHGLSGEIPADIGNLVNLTYVNLGRNELSGPIPPEIGNLINLEELDLHYNQLQGLPPEIGNLTNLNRLELKGNNLTLLPSEIGNMAQLMNLELDENEITGTIPATIGNLQYLVKLDVSDNELSGEIPPEIGNLTNLEYLYLFDNELTGSIPSEIGNLTGLITLFVNENNLSGAIPDEICNITELWNTGFYDNYFCPPYPVCLTAEEYEDTNGNGVYDDGEPYTDRNGNGWYDFERVGEQDTTNCD